MKNPNTSKLLMRAGFASAALAMGLGGASCLGRGIFGESCYEVSPTSGPPGTLVSLTGSNFTATESVSFGGASVLSFSPGYSSTAYNAFVLPSSSSGEVAVNISGMRYHCPEQFNVTSIDAPYTQTAGPMVPSGAIGTPHMATSLAISADGTTAAAGGYNDNGSVGAVWIFTRSGATWTQQAKLVGSGYIGAPAMGLSVALSADGNTVAFGGVNDNATVGAVWVFTRTGTTWTQQGNKLVGTGYVGAPYQGQFVALSADGNTLVSPGWQDNSQVGAIWVFTRSNGVWSQQGAKLVGTGNVGAGLQGQTAAISADGNTIAWGSPWDNSNVGAAWIFTRSNGTWTQQAKVAGTGAVGGSLQGTATALSSDGNTLLLGGTGDAAGVGAAWVFVRQSGTWTQQGSKLVGTGYTGASSQGSSGDISADGNLILVGGSTDNSNLGAVWYYKRTGTTWTQFGTKRVPTGYTGSPQVGLVMAMSKNGKAAVVSGRYNNASTGAFWYYAP